MAHRLAKPFPPPSPPKKILRCLGPASASFSEMKKNPTLIYMNNKKNEADQT